ncbi:acyl-CoA dehydrogenase family protein [Rhodococcus opacus]|uniref:Acyl-CoA dehydrogenase family protein n=1 Tax=Rhodococcus opacus TaxID=37919 RepID=A0AAX3YQI5_RHOOP|nr:acyl-CoA dehydrogenase family protein [Rhodococcus opacus]MCZ4587535.1 acyl-CoA dehydrogenase family protein [Rhodococcus opacus]WLF51463.1 acyl-CoA dehydrogenase family protein [Rhodococcus opacus]
MTTTASTAPAATAVLENVTKLVPTLRANALNTEHLRRVPEENIEALQEAGVFKLSMPHSRGGYEASMSIQNAVLSEIARGCPSTSWVATINLAVTWMVGLFPDAAQDEVFSTDNLRTAGVNAPTGKGVRTDDGGILVNGQWGWNTGSLNAHWAGLAAMVTEKDGSVGPQFLLIPYSELDSIDDWNATGMGGTGSVSTVAKDVYVPRHRVLSVIDLGNAHYPGSTLSATNPYFAKPGTPNLVAVSAGTPHGIAKGAMDVFHERLPGRTITYTDYPSQIDAPITHLQVGEATMKNTSLDAHLDKINALIDDNVGKEMSMLDRVAVRGHAGHLADISRDIVQILFRASGSSAIQTSVPIQRYHRDIQALALHALMQPTTATELYGRVLVGLPPNSVFI